MKPIEIGWAIDNPSAQSVFFSPIKLSSIRSKPISRRAVQACPAISDFEDEDWQQLIDRVAPRYWDLSREPYGQEIKNWRASPQMFSSLIMIPDSVRSGA